MAIIDLTMKETIQHTVFRLMDQQDEANVESRQFRMSEMGHPALEGYCPRRRILHYFNVPEEISDVQRQVFARGFLTEILLGMILSEVYGAENVKQKPFPLGLEYISDKGWKMCGHPDVATYGSGKKNWQVPRIDELKSINVDADVSEPKPQHVIQENAYIVAAHKTLGWDLSPGRIIYWLEGRQWDIMPFIVEPDVNLWDTCLVENDRLYEQFVVPNLAGKQPGFIMPEILPERLPKIDFPCIWASRKYVMRCGYFASCWADTAFNPKKPDIIESKEVIELIAKIYDATSRSTMFRKQADKARGILKATGIPYLGKVAGGFTIGKNGIIGKVRAAAGEQTTLEETDAK
jgi:hypothetical protein